MKRAAVVALVAIAGIYLAVAAFLTLAQRSLIFPAPAGARSAAGRVLEAPGFRALWVPPPAGAPVVVYFHGNGDDLADVGPVIDLLRSIGVGVLAVEYPGYGLSRQDGPPSETGCYGAAAAALPYLHSSLHAGPVILLGWSIGSGVAVEMAARGFGERLVLISPFTSLPDAAAVGFPWLPVRLAVRHRFANSDKAPRISIPVLLVHGADDEIVPASMSGELERRFPRATRRIVPHAGHNDLFTTHAGEVRAALAEFFAASW